MLGCKLMIVGGAQGLVNVGNWGVGKQNSWPRIQCQGDEKIKKTPCAVIKTNDTFIAECRKQELDISSCLLNSPEKIEELQCRCDQIGFDAMKAMNMTLYSLSSMGLEQFMALKENIKDPIVEEWRQEGFFVDQHTLTSSEFEQTKEIYKEKGAAEIRYQDIPLNALITYYSTPELKECEEISLFGSSSDDDSG